MSRRQLLLGCTVVISAIYAVLFYAVFSVGEDRSEPVLLQSINEKIDTLYWLQAGVFKEKSSYEQLRKQLSDTGFTVYCIPKDELTVVIINPSANIDEWNLVKQKADGAGIDVIEKQASLNEVQVELWNNKEIEKLLKELVNE